MFRFPSPLPCYITSTFSTGLNMQNAKVKERFNENRKQRIQIDSWDEVHELELNAPLKVFRLDEIEKYFNDKYECSTGELY